MNQRNNWFKEIDPPSSSGLGASISYLDQLIGGGNTQKQYLYPPLKKTTTREKPKQNIIKRSLNHQIAAPKLGIDVDDTKWIEERKKRFPKVGGIGERTNSSPSLKSPTTRDQVSYDDHSTQECHNVQYRSETREDHHRKRTLFEKLMDSS